ncbi:Multifunctional pyrimidine synthesis protein CAD [Aspergillus melleus]|uniref:Multifunctional pyrimidine synthesis protein CAD n=1 Tax=Aspergillus melleus TaxID=138277 RepID=A0ACC3B5L8_9EURO|nr:Multifunctional pyrimidine synthesis protein CAD [Aspergillus melleus]
MIHKSRPIFSTQFHPEAKGGPLDSSYLFDIYLDSVIKYKTSQLAFHPTRETTPSPLLVDLLAKERVGVQPTIGMQNVAATAAAAAVAA